MMPYLLKEGKAKKTDQSDIVLVKSIRSKSSTGTARKKMYRGILYGRNTWEFEEV